MTWTLLWIDPWIKFYNYDKNNFYIYVDPLDTLLSPYLRLTTESSFKIIIIIIFVCTLTWVNNQPHLLLGSCPESIPESGFKTIIIIITFILMLTLVNSGQSDPWPRLCTRSTCYLGFKIMIIIIFIFTCFNLIILKLRVFYNDILEIINNKYYLSRQVPFASSVLKVHEFTLKLFQKHIYFYSFISSTKYFFYLYFFYIFLF
jgi:hypothetical protein